jgi:transposase
LREENRQNKGDTTQMNYLINEADWQWIYLQLCEEKRIRIRDEQATRTFMEAICYMAKGGCQWRLLPAYYGHWRAVHKRFSDWQRLGIWEKLFKNAQKEPDLEWFMMDATIVRAHACAAGSRTGNQEEEGLGRSVGGFTSKIHMSTDALGNVLDFVITGGQVHDVTQAKELTTNVTGSTIIADKGYDSDELVEHLKNKSCEVIIPPRRNRKEPRDYDKYLYKARHVIENFFSKIKHFRLLFSIFDKKKDNFLSFLHFASVLILLR